MHNKRWLIVLVLALVTAACGGPTAPPPDPLELLAQAAEYIQTADSFGVTIDLSGAPVMIDTAGIIGFIRATGSYVAPDRVQARVRATVAGIAGDVDVIAIGDEQYFRHSILTGGGWLNAEFSPGFNAEDLVRSESGLGRALGAVNDLELIGAEDVDGIQMWHLTGTAVGSEVAAITFGLIPAEADVLVDVYIRVDDGHAERLVLVQPDTASEQYAAST
ncbi:MAG: LppX_LprAFG lipoprotein, partial [Anaerolineae bacterium]|nr:LppX_LprAFG lipoprotein [Anaerolineae bacterium]